MLIQIHTFLLALLGAILPIMPMAPADPQVHVTELDAGYYLIADDSANLVLYAGHDASYIAGIQRPGLVARARQMIQEHHAGPVRYVVLMEDAGSLRQLDGGWGQTGAVTLAHELLNNRLRQQARAEGLAPPALGFSHVLQCWVGDEEIHAIHDRAGYTDADIVVHIEKSGILYLGNTFTMDGYPTIDLSRGGTLKGMIETADYFITPDWPRERLEPIVPGRGPAATVRDLIAYRDMLVAIRDRVRAGVDASQSLDQIVASRPTQDFDERWGHGPVAPADFVKMVYQSLSARAPAR